MFWDKSRHNACCIGFASEELSNLSVLVSWRGFGIKRVVTMRKKQILRNKLGHQMGHSLAIVLRHQFTL